MEITGYMPFHYLILATNYKILEFHFIKEFESCIKHLSELCSCQDEIVKLKRQECEERYKDIVLNHIEEIKSFLFEVNSDFVFKSKTNDDEVFLTSLSKEE
jgi:hypothetical protein